MVLLHTRGATGRTTGQRLSGPPPSMHPSRRLARAGAFAPENDDDGQSVRSDKEAPASGSGKAYIHTYYCPFAGRIQRRTVLIMHWYQLRCTVRSTGTGPNLQRVYCQCSLLFQCPRASDSRLWAAVIIALGVISAQYGQSHRERANIVINIRAFFLSLGLRLLVPLHQHHVYTEELTNPSIETDTSLARTQSRHSTVYMPAD